MTEKLKDYQVLDVQCGGTFYKVRHKVTNEIFAWRAYDCSSYSDEQVKSVARDVETLSKLYVDGLLRPRATIEHAPSRTLYVVLEHCGWRRAGGLAAGGRRPAEGFLWYLLHELARLCRELQAAPLHALRASFSPDSIYVDESGELRVDCLELPRGAAPDPLRQIGAVLRALCAPPELYSEDLRDVLAFLTDEKHANMRPDVVLYHPTVLANLETLAGPKNLSDILIPIETLKSSDINKCDFQKAVERSRAVEPAPRYSIDVLDSPIYCNITPKKAIRASNDDTISVRASMSPTIAALALELPGFVPRSRQPISQALETYNNPQIVSEKTLSQQWMSRLISLRQREESLNKRERELIAKEIVSSPAAKVLPLEESLDEARCDSNGITLPPMMNQMKAERRNSWASRRRRARSSSVRRGRNRKSLNFDDLDSSLSADQGDSIVVTATKFTADNLPRRAIFPEVCTKKVHFTAANPFVESDESVTLTFYELENVDGDGYQVARNEEKALGDITKFKYLDLEKATTEKRAAMQQWSHSSPSKQAKITKQIFADITNTNFKRTPSKSSLMSKASNTSNGTQLSSASSKSGWSVDCGGGASGARGAGVARGAVSDRTRASVRQSLALLTPAPDVKKPKSRMSLLPFKTPFKFLSSK